MTTRVLVASGAVLTRRALTELLRGVDGIEVVGVAATPTIAAAKLAGGVADVVVCDTDDAFPAEGVVQWCTTAPVVAVVLVDGPDVDQATSTTAGGRIFALTRPPSRQWNADFAERRLIPTIRALARRFAAESPPVATRHSRSATGSSVPTVSHKIDLVVVGVSTGGPDALAELLARLPAPTATPIVVVQHMPAEFIAGLADRLTRVSDHAVHPAADGERLIPGTVVVAAGGRHLTIARDGEHLVARYDDSPPENSCRPAVDVLFRTAAVATAGAVLGVVLTGMGSDGLAGSRAIRSAGGSILTQDEASSVVWGMPGIVTGAGLSYAALSLPEIAAEIVARSKSRRPGSFIEKRART